jgi:tetraacyldisaccharide 4'-kinase
MTAGDEPLQYFRLLKNTIVAVDEKRANGIHELLQLSNAPKVIILDDAFQHRSVKPGLSILLTEYDRLYVKDHMLPHGRLREPVAGAERADLIIVTKCPADITEQQQKEVTLLLHPLPQQQIFFSYMRYSDEIEFDNGVKEAIDVLRNKAVFLLSGIDNPVPLANFLKTQCTRFDQQLFADHHPFTAGDLTNVRKKFDKFVGSDQGIIITTRKDLMRLQSSELKVVLKGIPLAVVDIMVAFAGTESNTFKQEIIQYVKSN